MAVAWCLRQQLLLFLFFATIGSIHSFVIQQPKQQQQQNPLANNNKGVPISSTTTNDNNNDKDNNADDNVVSVITVKRVLPTSPEKAKQAWMEYVFIKGGGLPTLVWMQNNNKNNKNENQQRLLVPLMAKEEIIQEDDNNHDSNSSTSKMMIQYFLKEMGPIWKSEIKADSHLGTVRFDPINADDNASSSSSEAEEEECIMTWTSRFITLRRKNLWETTTKWFLNTASDNLVASLMKPLVYTQRTTFNIIVNNNNNTIRTTSGDDGNNENNNYSTLLLTPRMIMHEWINFVFRQGGGLPMLPPIVVKNNYCHDDNNNNNKNHDAINDDGDDAIAVPLIETWRIPPFLREQIITIIPHGDVTTDSSKQQQQSSCKVIYRVANPGFISCYPVFTHKGQVEFITSSPIIQEENQQECNHDDDSTVEMIWTVKVRPYPGIWHPFVKIFTSAIVSTLSRNLKVWIQIKQNCGDDDDFGFVQVKPPRGIGDRSLVKIPRETWLGAVLEAHLKDGRSTWQQTISLFQPWTWGRIDDDDNEVEGVWSEHSY